MTAPRIPWNNPMSPAAIDAVIGLLDLRGTDRVLDVGCGNGAILGRVLDRYECRAVGVDRKPDEIDAAAKRLAGHAPRVTLHAADVADVELADHAFHAALCIGSTHAFGGPGVAYDAALDALARVVAPGGLIIVGEGFWRRDPDEGYLAATGMGRGDFVAHADNVDRAETRGLIPLYVAACSETDWDDFESRFWLAAEANLLAHPGDAAAIARADHWRGWRRAYLRWGRDTLGFALYLFRRP